VHGVLRPDPGMGHIAEVVGVAHLRAHDLGENLPCGGPATRQGLLNSSSLSFGLLRCTNVSTLRNSYGV